MDLIIRIQLVTLTVYKFLLFLPSKMLVVVHVFFILKFPISFLYFAKVQLYKNNEKTWVTEIWLAEELFNYLHPFIFKDLFKNKLKYFGEDIIAYLPYNKINIKLTIKLTESLQ